MIKMRVSRDALTREECARSLPEFVRRAWRVLEPGTRYIEGEHIKLICDHLQAVTDGRINRLLINIPPGAMKSMLVSIFWPAWEWGPRGLSSNRIISASHEAGLSTRDNRRMRLLVQSEWYQRLWPIQLVGDQNEKTYFENESGGWRQSCPVRSMTGRRGDRVIWDDPHSVEDAYSAARLAEAERVFRETLPSRLNDPAKSAIVVVMQRLSDKDISGVILSGDYGYTHLMLPMEFEPGRKCVTAIGQDWREHEGDLLFPARFPREVVERDKKVMKSAHAVAGQFQQRPAPLGGGLIKGEWFARHKVLPRMVERVIIADTAQKTAERNDYSVFACYGKGEDGKLYLIDLIRGKWEAPELHRRAVAFWAKHKARDAQRHAGALRKMYIEDKASGTGLIQQIRSDAGCPVVAVQRGRDKLTRLMDVQGYIESGYVSVPADAEFTSDFVAECESFAADDSHAYDDQLDTLIDAINVLLVRQSGFDLAALT